MTKVRRFNMTLPAWLKDSVAQVARNKGISMAEYVKDVLKESVAKDIEGVKSNHSPE